MTDDIAAVVLAAGHGTRLRPLTDIVPKALCPVNNVALLDRAISNVRSVTGAVAVNAHALADQIVARLCGGDVHVEVEAPEALGTAGALANLADWISGRDVLVHNADAWHDADIRGRLLDGWDGERMRLLVVDRRVAADFGTLLYAGVCLLPARELSRLEPAPTGLYEILWRDRLDELDLVVHEGAYFDCGTPRTYLAANLHASGGESVVAPTARVEPGAEVVRSVVWAGAVVHRGERLVDAIRAPGDVTVHG